MSSTAPVLPYCVTWKTSAMPASAFWYHDTLSDACWSTKVLEKNPNLVRMTLRGPGFAHSFTRNPGGGWS